MQIQSLSIIDVRTKASLKTKILLQFFSYFKPYFFVDRWCGGEGGAGQLSEIPSMLGNECVLRRGVWVCVEELGGGEKRKMKRNGGGLR